MKLHEKYLVFEGNAFFNKTVKKIAKMTDDNYHSGAIALGLELLGLDTDAKKAKALVAKIDKDGGYTSGSTEDKQLQKFYKLMMDTAKKNLSSSDYSKFYGAF